MIETKAGKPRGHKLNSSMHFSSDFMKFQHGIDAGCYLSDKYVNFPSISKLE